MAGEAYVGGLAGLSGGTISASYATGTTTGDRSVGGLVGLSLEGRIVASYATGAVIGRERVGGVVGRLGVGNGAEVARSYSERHAAGEIAVGLPASSVGSRTTADLLDPSGYDGIYRDWNIDLDGDGEATSREFGPQRGPSRVAVETSATDVDGIVVMWDAPLDAGDEITRYELQRRVGGEPFADVDPPHSGAGTS